MPKKTTKKIAVRPAASNGPLAPRVRQLETGFAEVTGELRVIKLFGAGTFLAALANFLVTALK